MRIYIYFFFSTADQDFVCENVTLAMDYQFFWKGNGITSVNLTRSVGTISFNGSGKKVSLRQFIIYINSGGTFVMTLYLISFYI